MSVAGKALRRAPALSGMPEISDMLSFQLIGKIGCIEIRGADLTRISVETEALWVNCECADEALCAQVLQTLGVGDLVRVCGDLEPRARVVHGVMLYDVRLVVRIVEKLKQHRWRPT